MRFPLSLLVMAMLATAACGTALYDHRIEVSINDPSGRLGNGPVRVSIFDKRSGYSEEWAARFLGTTAPGALYVGDLSDTATRMMFDEALPQHVEAGLALPAYAPGGYYLLSVTPAAGQSQPTTLTYTPWSSYAPEPGAATLSATVRSEPLKKGWLLHLTVDLPPVPKPH